MKKNETINKDIKIIQKKQTNFGTKIKIIQIKNSLDVCKVYLNEQKKESELQYSAPEISKSEKQKE